MSEYQYYEFAALDGPISDEGLHYAEHCSTRASVSRVHWQNEYDFGRFGGSAEKLLQYYDVHLYYANWGTVSFAVSFPKDALDLSVIQPYLQYDCIPESVLTVNCRRTRVIIWWEYCDDDATEWFETNGLINRLAGIREEILRCDYRSLFLGWLSDYSAFEGDVPEEEPEFIPPIPDGLNSLTPAQECLLELFPVDPDAMNVAAGESENLSTARLPVSEVLDRLSKSQMKELLIRVSEGDGAGVMSELNRRVCSPDSSLLRKPLRFTAFNSLAAAVCEKRLKEEAEQAEAENRRKAAERKRFLENLVEKADKIWAGLEPLMEKKNAPAYDNVAGQLKELHDAYSELGRGDDPAFCERLNEFRERYARRPSMMRRIRNL